MPWFKCLVHGEDFPGIIAGWDEPAGFYVTRVVEVAHGDEAEAAVVEVLRTEPKLQLPTDFQIDTEPKVFVEEIEGCSPDDADQIAPGFVFFKMSDG